MSKRMTLDAVGPDAAVADGEEFCSCGGILYEQFPTKTSTRVYYIFF